LENEKKRPPRGGEKRGKTRRGRTTRGSAGRQIFFWGQTEPEEARSDRHYLERKRGKNVARREDIIWDGNESLKVVSLNHPVSRAKTITGGEMTPWHKKQEKKRREKTLGKVVEKRRER